MAPLFFSLRRLFMTTELSADVTRIEWICSCGHNSYDDFTSKCKAMNALEHEFRDSKVLRSLELTTSRKSLLYEWMVFLHNVVVSPFRHHVSSDSSAAGSSSSAPPEIWSVGSDSSTSGSGVQAPFDEPVDISTVTVSRRNPALRRKPVEPSRKRFLHICVDIGGVTGLEVVEISGQGSSQFNINCDQELFKKLKMLYKREWWKGYGYFLKLQAIRFVQFELWRGGLVDHLIENRLPKNTLEYEFFTRPG
ncbi:uncharacterized protein PAC_01329 [Phialocephala subalpina]|uniref:Uncharacterized protein n=1 Tax=Phialocephala subalpina TaxID=576137 RepID=A0A1L7WFA8_9HELO|nr:uncharacterized protein PAC_01329 [Phialocephala subalpina]